MFSFDPPIYRHPLYQPGQCRRFPADHVERLAQSALVRLPQVEQRAADTLCLPHRLLLGRPRSMERIRDALAKVLA